MVLVAKEAPAMLLGPARVAVFLAQLRRLLLPLHRRLPGLDGFVLVTAVALLRHRHNRGINHLSAPRNVTLRLQMLVKAIEQLLDQPSFGELLAIKPQRGRIRDTVLDA